MKCTFLMYPLVMSDITYLPMLSAVNMWKQTTGLMKTSLVAVCEAIS